MLEVLQQPAWYGWVITNGITLFALSQGLVWLADKVGNLTGAFDVPDGKYGFYSSWVVGVLAILLILNATSGLNFDINFLASLIVSVLSALGYDFGSKARALRRSA